MNVNFLYHIHLNLCISLLLGLTVFLFGLETAIHYNVMPQLSLSNIIYSFIVAVFNCCWSPSLSLPLCVCLDACRRDHAIYNCGICLGNEIP